MGGSQIYGMEASRRAEVGGRLWVTAHRPRVTVLPAATWSAETPKWERLNEPCECWLALVISRAIHHRVVSPVAANDPLKQGASGQPRISSLSGGKHCYDDAAVRGVS